MIAMTVIISARLKPLAFLNLKKILQFNGSISPAKKMVYVYQKINAPGRTFLNIKKSIKK